MIKKKQYKWGAIIVITFTLCIWINSRWDAWFHNPEEMPYTPATVPDRVLLTFGNDGELSRMVSWTCDTTLHDDAALILANDSDTISIPATGEVFQSRAGKAAFYRASMNDLKADHEYSYSVITNGSQSPWYSFRTHNPENRSFSFIYMGDVQDSIGGIAHSLIVKAVKAHPEVEFMAFGGDLIERPIDAYYAETFRSIDSLCTAMPVLNITGNHDYLKYVIRKCERRFALVFPYFLKGMDEREDENHLFSMRYHNTDFFLLDSDREFPYLLQQKSWLEKELANSTGNNKIVMIHHPLYSVKKPNNNIIQRWVFNDMIKEAGTALVLQGHEHSYAHCTADENPLTEHECTNPPLYTVSHCSPKHYVVKPSKRFHPVLTGSQYYQIITVNNNIVTMKAYDANNGTMIDSIKISHK